MSAICARSRWAAAQRQGCRRGGAGGKGRAGGAARHLGLLGGNASAALVGDALVGAVGAHEELIHVQLVLEVSALHVLGKRVRLFALIVGARRHGALGGEETAGAHGPARILLVCRLARRLASGVEGKRILKKNWF